MAGICGQLGAFRPALHVHPARTAVSLPVLPSYAFISALFTSPRCLLIPCIYTEISVTLLVAVIPL